MTPPPQTASAGNAAQQAVSNSSAMPSGQAGSAKSCAKQQSKPGPWSVKIIWIKGHDGSAYHGSAKEADLKTHDILEKPLKFHYGVYGQTQIVNLWIECTTKVQKDFYLQYKKGGFQPPRVVWLVRNAERDPGEYDLEWDGRDQTPDRRLLLADTYKVIITGQVGGEKKQDETTLKIAKPRSVNLGIHYYKLVQDKSSGKWSKKWESCQKDVQAAEKSQKSLGDGTSFDTASHLDFDASAAVASMKDSAAFFWGGHSNPFGFWLHAATGKKDKKKDCCVRTQQSLGQGPNDAQLDKEAVGAFKDLFLVLLSGCNTGNEVAVVQQTLAWFDPGPIDGKHGPKTRHALKIFQYINKIVPVDGEKNPLTLSWFHIPPVGVSEEEQTRRIQTKLRSYVGTTSGHMDDKTEQALLNYQRDRMLWETGEPDLQTQSALRITSSENSIFLARNVTEAMQHRGADISIGFIHETYFGSGTDWDIAFWDHLAKGFGVKTAADYATALLPARWRKAYEYNIYAEPGVDRDVKLTPARWGKIT